MSRFVWAVLAAWLTVAAGQTAVTVWFIGDLSGSRSADGAQFKTGFDMAVKEIADTGGAYTLNVIECDTGSTDTGAEACVTRAHDGSDPSCTAACPATVIVAGTASSNVAIIAAAQNRSIPNIHLSGGNPTMWLTQNSYAVGLHVPFVDYTRGLMNHSETMGLQSIGILRSYAHGYARTSGIAALKWARDYGLRVIGPSAAWCNRWASMTQTCRMVGENCRCGNQTEIDALVPFMGAEIDYNIEGVSTFYEIDESMLGNGFSTGDVIDTNTTAFIEGIIQDMQMQRAPDVFLNFAAEWHNALNAIVKADYSPRMLMGWQGGVTSGWAAQTDVNGASVLQAEHGYWAVGFGQWHSALVYNDPLFGTTTAIVEKYETDYGQEIHYNIAGGAVAGVLINEALKVSGAADSRDNMKDAIRGLDFESLWGPIKFNAAGQATGRGTAAWQIIPDANGDPQQMAVMPSEAKETDLVIPFPPWCSRFGNTCPDEDSGMTCGELRRTYRNNQCCGNPARRLQMQDSRRFQMVAK